VYLALGDIRVSEIAGPLIHNVLAEIRLSKPETARRVRQRIGVVLDCAFASGYRDTEAPVRSITKGLSRQPRKTTHPAAMPYNNLPAFLADLRSKHTVGRRALEFAILTVARSGELRLARWEELDLTKGGMDNPPGANEG